MAIIETGNYDHLSDTDITAIKEAAKERSKALLRIDAEKELMSEITTTVKENFKIKASDFNALAAMYHKQDIDAQKAKFENRCELFDMVFGKDDQDPETETDDE